jgi:hypothetical protein
LIDSIEQRKRALRPPGSLPPAPEDTDKPAVVDGKPIAPLDYLLSVVRDRRCDAFMRLQAARAAAPYCHARLSPAPEQSAVSDHIPLADRVAYYLRRDTIASSYGKVVDLPVPKSNGKGNGSD